MVVCVCMNPSFDRTLETDVLVPGALNRVSRSRTDPGGKGVNVAAMLTRLGDEALCIGLAGEDGADRLSELLSAGSIPHRFQKVPGAVRVNTKVISRVDGRVTEINEPGPVVGEEQLKDFFRMAHETCCGADFAVLSGSLPPGCPQDAYGRLIDAIAPVPCALDTGGELLRRSIGAKPFLVKPNLPELREAFGLPLREVPEIIRAARSLTDGGAALVCVSMGAEGALLVSARKAWLAPPLPVKVRSAVGAGDAMLAGLIHGWLHSGDPEEAFRHGVAAGTAGVMSDGTQPASAADYRSLLLRVSVMEVRDRVPPMVASDDDGRSD